tara:strand:- start:4374 stop:5024 length:651 start_codon:yes stop_codon:yes gene_type:complete
MSGPFKIKATLKTPIIIRGHLTFDALLGSILFDLLGDVEAAHAAIPIECVDGLYHASSAKVVPLNTGSFTFVANLRAQHDLDPDLIKKNKAGSKLHSKVSLGRRRNFGPVLNSYNTIFTEGVEWDVIGDEDKVFELLNDAHFIGKKRTAGFGEVKQWETFESTTDGLVDDNGAPMRPVPADRFTGDKSLPIVDAAWRPAYWNPENRGACYAPSLPA